MTCGNCEAAINDAVKRLPGVAQCTASHKGGRVQVSFAGGNASHNLRAVRNVVEKLGFEVKQARLLE